MIIVKLQGGLGNQMFQYALGRNLSNKTGNILKFDLSYFNQKNKSANVVLRELLLNKFSNVNLIEAKIDEIHKIKTQKRLKKWFFKTRNTYYKEKSFEFDSKVLNLKGNIYLEGYWQSPNYFNSINDNILHDFELIPSKNTFRYLDNITSSPSISVHFRRGDYASIPHINKVHGCLSLEYYHRALKEIKKKVQNPRFFLFSDDKKWVKKNFELNEEYMLIDDKTLTTLDELFLMSSCDHNIIANSTYSWWAAWLNRNKKKTVLSPANWFNKSTFNTKDLLPQSWVRL